MKRQSLWMLRDDVRDTMADVKQMGEFLLEIGKHWEKCRSHHYKTMPERLLRMLDELTEIMVCEEKNCREPVHKDWDFCFEHGHKKHKWEDDPKLHGRQTCYCGEERKAP